MSQRNAKVLYLKLLKRLEDYTSPCANNGTLFDTDESIPIELRQVSEPVAKDLCKDCELLYLCLDYALEANEPYGIWGGTTPAERQKINHPLNKAVRMVREAEQRGITLPKNKTPDQA